MRSSLRSPASSRPDGAAVITVPNDPLILRVKGIARHRPFRWLVRGRVDWGGDDFHLHRWTPAEFERCSRRTCT